MMALARMIQSLYYNDTFIRCMVKEIKKDLIYFIISIEVSQHGTLCGRKVFIEIEMNIN